MLGHRSSNQAFTRAALLSVLLALSGCSLLAPTPEPVADAPDGVVEPLPPPPPEPDITPPKPVPLPAVAIVLTGQQPAYADIATELARQLDDYEIHDLSDGSEPPVTILREINDTGPGAVIAIGLRAAQSSVSMAAAPVVFSQVFNYQDHELLTANSRGVASLPPLDAQLAAWKKIDPSLERVGAIIGVGHDDLIVEAEAAAERHGIDLRMAVTRSDQETLYVFRRMVRDIDGFWLFPDNRILSGRVLQQMLGDANRLHIAVAAPSESMLAVGAAISFSSVAADIADTIVAVVRAIQAGNLDNLPPITSLSEIRVRTNDGVQVADR